MTSAQNWVSWPAEYDDYKIQVKTAVIAASDDKSSGCSLESGRRQPLAQSNIHETMPQPQ